ncbi:hypothetical protein K457DRAFT_728160 [Linnemannia elongata AG-77]|uniref:Uncharacterized protein n=1 Tax=Linnemannia elongata AG-77 TaxID=1314771 RepID=A0A197JLQ7_9FUNG|nr:hypothetical protein K457DRAFT_728160 [Linnemannia elongata AG-77]
MGLSDLSVLAKGSEGRKGETGGEFLKGGEEGKRRGEKGGDGGTEEQTNRQTDKQTNRQTDKQTNRQTDDGLSDFADTTGDAEGKVKKWIYEDDGDASGGDGDSDEMDTGRVCMVQEIIDQMSQPVAPPVLDAFIISPLLFLALSFFFFPLCPLLHLVTHSTLTHTLSISTNITINQKKTTNKHTSLYLSLFTQHLHTQIGIDNHHHHPSPFPFPLSCPCSSSSSSSSFSPSPFCLVPHCFFSSEEDNHCYFCFCTLLYSSKTTNKNQQQTTTNKKQPHFLFPFFFLSPLLFSFLFSSLLFLVHSSFFLSPSSFLCTTLSPPTPLSPTFVPSLT